MDYIMSMFHSGEEGHDGKPAQGRDERMTITTPVAGMDIGDLPTPVAEPSQAAFKPPAATTDKRLQTWRIGPRYVVTNVIGRGSYGEVAAGIDTMTNRKIAIKRIRRIFTSSEDARRIYREMYILRHLKHPNSTKLLDVLAPDYAGPAPNEKTEIDIHSPKKRQRGEGKPVADTSLDDIYLIFEFLDTDMHKLISSNQFLSSLHIKTFLYQMLAGLKYIHSSQVIHRDIKPANLLLTEDCALKICDFGLSRVVKPDDAEVVVRSTSGISEKKGGDSSEESGEDVNIEEDSGAATTTDRLDDMESGPVDEDVAKPSSGIHRTLTRHVVTRWYRAPELILLQHYTCAVDMWSVGCVLGELLSMQPENVRDYRNRKALFPGSACPSLSNDGLKSNARGESRGDRYDQLSVILDLIGSPSTKDVDLITDPQIRLFLRNQPVIPPKVFNKHVIYILLCNVLFVLKVILTPSFM
jgi:mitogen-activated protein kinase 1/3